MRTLAGYVRGRSGSVRCAWWGVAFMVRSQRNAQVHVAVSAGVVCVGWLAGLSAGEWCWILAAMGMVWVAEAMNTALEVLCDVVCVERHEGIGRVKDVAAGGVLLAAVCASGIGVCVLGPALTALCRRAL
jgi:diacylglycerol kinase (ATP)